jgi:MFS family permease
MARRGVGPSGWRPAAVLTGVVLVDAMDQGVVPGTLSLLQDDWGFSDTLAGAIPTAALIVGVLALVPAGWMADHLHRTRLLTVVVASWALLSAASAMAVSFATFFAVRMALGGAISEVSGSLQLAIVLAVFPAIPGALVVLRGRRTFAADAAAARAG